MPSSYEERIIKLQQQGLKPNLSREREDKINALIAKYQALILKRNQKMAAPARVSKPKKSYEQKIMELQQKIAARDAKVKTYKAEPMRLKSSFVGPLLPDQSRKKSMAELMQERAANREMLQREKQRRLLIRQDKATAKRMVKEALMAARMEARTLKQQQREAKKLIKQGQRSTARASRASARVRNIIG